MTTSAINFFHVDSGLTYNGAPATTITGLDHLEGEEVAILADGEIVANQTVSGGSITLSTPAAIVHIGLPYNTDIGTLRLDQGDGTFQGKVKRIHKLILRLYQTLGFTVGRDSSRLDTVTHSDLTTDDAEVLMEDTYNQAGQIFIRQSNAAPLTLLALIPKFEVYNE